MPTSPKPPGQRRRRNVTGVMPDHNVPLSGRKGPVPRSPLTLGVKGRAFWRYCWRTPQACTWHEGHVYALALLAELIDNYNEVDVDFVDTRSKLMVRIEKGMTEFGLTPKAMLAMHLFAVDDEKLDDQGAEIPDVPDESELELRRRAKGMASG